MFLTELCFFHKRDIVVATQFQNCMEYNGPSSRADATFNVLKIELIHMGEELTSCDITPYLGERWKLTSELSMAIPTKVNETSFYKFTRLAQDGID